MLKFLQKAKFVILDADGTVFDTIDIYTSIFVALVERYGVQQDRARDFYSDTAGMPLDRQFSKILERSVNQDTTVTKALTDGLVREFFGLVEQEPAPVFDDVIHFLIEVQKNTKLCFMTSGTRTDILERRLRKANIRACFSMVLGSDNIPKGIEHLSEFAKSQRLELAEFAKQAYYIGDGPSDIHYAKGAGMTAIGLVRKPKENSNRERIMREAGANEIISFLEELLE